MIEHARRLPDEYILVACDQWNGLFRAASLPVGACISCRSRWWLSTVSLLTTSAVWYAVRSLDNRRPSLLTLPVTAYCSAIGANCGSWCLRIYTRGSARRGTLRNSDESQAPVALPPTAPPLCSPSVRHQHFSDCHLLPPDTLEHMPTPYIRTAAPSSSTRLLYVMDTLVGIVLDRLRVGRG